MSRLAIHPGCGALGCTEEAEVVIDHPEHGERTVCDDHARDHLVVCRV